MNISRRIGVTTISLLTAATPLFVVGTAHAQGGNAKVHTGSCSGSSTWKLSAKPDNGQIEVQWEVDSNQAGQQWSVRLRDNGNLFFSGSRQTQAPSGSFSVKKFANNAAGDDVIRARSVHGDEVCHGSVTV